MSTQVLGQSPPNGVSVLVVGAGIGGLMTAIECARRGCSVRVLEKSASSVLKGDSFAIGPSAMGAFNHYPEMQAESDRIRQDPLIKFCDRHGVCQKGPLSMDALLAPSSVEKGRRIYRYLRPQMHAALLDQIHRMNIEVSYDQRVGEYWEDVDEGVGGVVLDDGSRLCADLVVAADGVRGTSWSLVAGHPVPARSGGDAMLRVAYPVELAMADPMVAERFPLYTDGKPTFEVWLAAEWSFYVWRTGDVMTWVLARPDPGTAKESWRGHIDVEEVLKETAAIPDWPEVADRLIRTTPPDQLVDWKIMWRDPQPQWTSPGGRVLQLGDAAHAFLPQSGNGGTQALEDAVSLAACLAVAGTDGDLKASIPDAARVHNLLRFERVSCLQAFGVQNRKVQRNDKGRPPHMGRWILDHDPEEYVVQNYHQALAHIRDGSPFSNTNTPPGVVYRPWTIEGLLQAHENGEPTILDGDWE